MWLTGLVEAVHSCSFGPFPISDNKVYPGGSGGGTGLGGVCAGCGGCCGMDDFGVCSDGNAEVDGESSGTFKLSGRKL